MRGSVSVQMCTPMPPTNRVGWPDCTGRAWPDWPGTRTATSRPTPPVMRCCRRAGLGVWGGNFGTDRPEWAGASGTALLRETAALVRAAGFSIGNVSIQVIGNAPRIGPRRAEAQVVLSEAV